MLSDLNRQVIELSTAKFNLQSAATVLEVRAYIYIRTHLHFSFSSSVVAFFVFSQFIEDVIKCRLIFDDYLFCDFIHYCCYPLIIFLYT